MFQADPKLVNACLAGDEGAWHSLVKRYGRLVYSIPRRYGFAEADADDVFQAVMLSLHRSLGQLREVERLSSWLITTTHRECWRAGRKRDEMASLPEGQSDSSEPSTELVEKWERQHLVRQALRELGGRCERLLSMLFLDKDEPDYQTIASRLDIRIGSIGPTRARCFEKLAAILADLGMTPDDMR
ncbi:MAG: sigma-70 family RNA polymerase sigma factor [Phycisphaerales bacterium]|nr:sigma-70 family RNA polymerase sigma factor [Phycisphaerales bacterium]